MDNKTVFIIDDDAGVRDSLALLLGLQGMSVRSFADAESFLSACRSDWRGCVLADMHLEAIGGLELQSTLRTHNLKLPVIIMTGHATVAAARTAFKAGAIDFLTKPVPTLELLAAIDEAMRDPARTGSIAEPHPANTEFDDERLTQRENEVLMLLYKGFTTREIAEQLFISPRTVETYKARMMKKLNVRRMTDLIRFAAEKGYAASVS